jgi:hypothetical protein
VNEREHNAVDSRAFTGGEYINDLLMAQAHGGWYVLSLGRFLRFVDGVIPRNAEHLLPNLITFPLRTW